MKIAVIIVRTLMGLLFLVSVIGYFFKLMPQPEFDEPARLFVTGMFASGYLMPIIKVTEALAAIALISGRFMPLATVVIFPIVVNILLFHAFLAPDSLVIPVFLFAGNLFLAYVYRKYYEPMMTVR